MKDIRRSINIVLYVIIACLVVYGGVSYFTDLNNTGIKNAMNTVSAQAAKEFNRQLECMTKNIYYEAGIESYEGKLAVAQVVLNRANSGNYPGDLCGVIYQRTYSGQSVVCQFSWTCMKVNNIVDKYVWQESYEIAKKVLTGKIAHEELARKNAMFYHANYVKPHWKKKNVVKTIGRHIFYKDIK